jgi:hypothetical protein
MLENKDHWTKLESRRSKVRIVLHCQGNKRVALMPGYFSAGLWPLQLLHRQESYCGGINISIPHRSQGIYLIPHHSFALVCS